MGLLSPLKHRATRLLWIGQTLSAIGDQCFGMAVIWIAARDTGSAAGLVGAAQYLPALLFGLLGGVFADRWNRRITMLVVDAARAAIVLALPVLAWFGSVQSWHLAVIGMLLQSVNPLFESALLASMPVLAESEAHLRATNGLMNSTRRLARLLGPLVVAGFALVLPIEQLFTFDALTFAISSITIAAIGARFAWKPTHDVARVAITRDLHEGLVLLRARPAMLWAFVVRMLSSVLWGMVYTIGLPLLFQREFDGGIASLSILISAYGMGNLVSNVLVVRRPLVAPYAVIWAGCAVYSLGLALIGAVNSLWLAVPLAFLASFGGPMMDLVQSMQVQTEIPGTHHGRIFALMQTWSTLWFVIGLLASTPLFALLPIRDVILVSGLLSFVVSVAGAVRWRRPMLRLPPPFA